MAFCHPPPPRAPRPHTAHKQYSCMLLPGRTHGHPLSLPPHLIHVVPRCPRAPPPVARAAAQVVLLVVVLLALAATPTAASLLSSRRRASRGARRGRSAGRRLHICAAKVSKGAGQHIKYRSARRGRKEGLVVGDRSDHACLRGLRCGHPCLMSPPRCGPLACVALMIRPAASGLPLMRQTGSRHAPDALLQPRNRRATRK